MKNCNRCSDFPEDDTSNIAEFTCEPCGDSFCDDCIKDHLMETHTTRLQTEKEYE